MPIEQIRKLRLLPKISLREWLVRTSIQHSPACFGASEQGSDDNQGKRGVCCLAQASSDQRGPEGYGDPQEGAEGAGPAPRQLSPVGEAPLELLTRSAGLTPELPVVTVPGQAPAP